MINKNLQQVIKRLEHDAYHAKNEHDRHGCKCGGTEAEWNPDDVFEVIDALKKATQKLEAIEMEKIAKSKRLLKEGEVESLFERIDLLLSMVSDIKTEVCDHKDEGPVVRRKL